MNRSLLALAVTACALTGCATAGGAPTQASPSPRTASPSLPALVSAVIATDHGPASFPLDSTSVYVANHRGGTLQRIDPATNRVVASGSIGGELNISNGAPPSWACTNVDSHVHHVDVGTLSSVSSIDAACDGGDIEVIQGVVWAVPGRDGTMIRLFDSSSGRLLRTMPFDPETSSGPAVLAAGRVVIGGGVKAPLYSVTGKPLGTVDVDLRWLVPAIAGRLYRVPEDGRIIELDPRTLRPALTVQAQPHYADWNYALTGDGAGRLWYRPDYTHLYEIDLATKTSRLLLTLPWEEVPTGIVYAFGSLWVSNFDQDTVWRVDVSR